MGVQKQSSSVETTRSDTVETTNIDTESHFEHEQNAGHFRRVQPIAHNLFNTQSTARPTTESDSDDVTTITTSIIEGDAVVQSSVNTGSNTDTVTEENENMDKMSIITIEIPVVKTESVSFQSSNSEDVTGSDAEITTITTTTASKSDAASANSDEQSTLTIELNTGSIAKNTRINVGSPFTRKQSTSTSTTTTKSEGASSTDDTSSTITIGLDAASDLEAVVVVIVVISASDPVTSSELELWKDTDSVLTTGISIVMMLILSIFSPC